MRAFASAGCRSTVVAAGESSRWERVRVELSSRRACLLWLSGCETSTKLGDLFQSRPTHQSDRPARRARPAPEPAVDRRRSAACDAAAATRARSVRPCSATIPTTISASARSTSGPPISASPSAFPPCGRAASARRRGLGRARGLLRPAAPLRPRRPRLRSGGDDRRADAGGAQQPRLFLHAARRLPARALDAAARAGGKDPGNPYIKNNLELLEASFRNGKAVQ